jgi:transposase
MMGNGLEESGQAVLTTTRWRQTPTQTVGEAAHYVNEEWIKTFVKMWKEGSSASTIARHLGVTKNVICGQRSRLFDKGYDLPPRDTLVQRNAENSARTKARREAQNAAKASTVVSVESVVDAATRTIEVSARSDAYSWLRRNYAALSAQQPPSWKALTKTAADEGIVATPNALRKAWLRLERDLAREAVTGRAPGGLFLVDCPQDERGLLRLALMY